MPGSAIKQEDAPGPMPRARRWRVAGWTGAALLLLAPLVAMQFTDEVNWEVADFVLAALLLLSVGIPLELAVRKSGDAAYRAGAGVALLGGFLLIWVNGAVGLIGSENNPANLMYGGVLAVGSIGALVARFRARGLSHAMFAAAAAQGLVAVIAIVGGMGGTTTGPGMIVVLNAFFVALFVGSAMLFREAARGGVERAA